MEQEVKNIKYRGISRALSDMSISDGGCAESVNVSVRNGDVAVICPPEEVEQLPKGIKYDLIYIHKMSYRTEYIGKKNNEIGTLRNINSTSTHTEDGTDGPIQLIPFDAFYQLAANEELNEIISSGNILILSTRKTNHFFIYEDHKYIHLGNKIPEANIRFWKLDVKHDGFTERSGRHNDSEVAIQIISTVETEGEIDLSYYFDNEESLGTINPYYYLLRGEDFQFKQDIDNNEINKIHFALGESESSLKGDYVNDVNAWITKKIWDQYAKLVNTYNKLGVLSRPIFIRYALRLYDGQYINQSSPVLIGNLDSFKITFFNYASKSFENGKYNVTDDGLTSYFGITLKNRFKVFADIFDIENLEQWKDIVQSIDFFISDPIDLTPTGTEIMELKNLELKFTDISSTEKEQALLTYSNFYRIKSTPILDIIDNQRIDFTEDLARYLGNLLPTQPRLEDGFNNLHAYVNTRSYLYNSRINYYSYNLDFYQGPPFFTSEQSNIIRLYETGKPWIFIFHIKGNDNNTYYRKKELHENIVYDYDKDSGFIQNDDSIVIPGKWIVYPDTRCFKVEIYHEQYGTITKWSYNLKRHPLLNCSYCILGNIDDDYFIWESEGEEVSSIPTFAENNESVSDTLIQSEVNNPFVFKPENIHTLPVNKILGMATNTQPVSQGQFGQYPIYVFTDDGVWAMQVQSDGTYMSAAPLSRDVCINPESITGIEGAVIFITQRGVMILSSSQIRCISDDMIGRHFDISDLDRADTAIRRVAAKEWQSDIPELVSDGMPFMDYMKDCFVAYDYGNRRLVFTNGTSYYQYVYDLASGTWHKMCFSKRFKRVLNSYPECYLQEDGDTSDTVYDFSVISDTYAVTDRHFGLIITRAFDLGDPSAFKRIDRILNRGDYEKGKVRCLLYGSNDYVHFVPVNSLKGSSYKSYRLVLFMDMLPSENVAMTTIGFTTRWNKRLR